jgi:hypothetical protein
MENLQEKKNKKEKGKLKKSDRLSSKQVDKALKTARKAALQTAKTGHSSFNADDKSAPVIHVKDPRDLLKFGASAVKKQVNYVKKNLEKQKTFEQFINQES